MYEVLSHYMDDIDNSNILEMLSIQQGNYFVVSARQEENVDESSQLLKLAES